MKPAENNINEHNLIQDLALLKSSGKKTRVCITLIDELPKYQMIQTAVSASGFTIDINIVDDELLSTKPEPLRKKITTFLREAPRINLEGFRASVREDETVLIISDYEKSNEQKITEIFSRHGISCCIYAFSDLPHSAEIDGQIRVFNSVEYAKSWPAFMDEIHGDMTDEEKNCFKNEKYPYNVKVLPEYFCLESHKSILTEIENGFISCGNSTDSFSKTVTLIGDSRFINTTFPSRLSIASLVQKKVSELNLSCRIRNFSTTGNTLQNILAQVQTLELSSGDRIVCPVTALGVYFGFCPTEAASLLYEDNDEIIQVKYLLMKKISDYCRSKDADVLFIYIPSVKDIPDATPIEKYIMASYGLEYCPNKSHRKLISLCAAGGVNVINASDSFTGTERKSLFTDETHLSYEGSEIIAGIISEYINNIYKTESDDFMNAESLGKALETHKLFLVRAGGQGALEGKEYVEYLKKTAEGKPDNCGFIAMNCNPFTLGHLYLVEEASKMVDHLYIVIVPEENPHFTFKDRSEMAKRAVAHLKNVEIIRSGNIYATRLTFPAYFERESSPDAKADVSGMLRIFLNQYAPILKIKKRFVGTEPLDRVTAQYNQAMKAALPAAGVELVEIERKEINSEVVSASRVRKLLKEGKYDEIRKIVPETTFSYLTNELAK